MRLCIEKGEQRQCAYALRRESRGRAKKAEKGEKKRRKCKERAEAPPWLNRHVRES
jgi:hypothetical protein